MPLVNEEVRHPQVTVTEDKRQIHFQWPNFYLILDTEKHNIFFKWWKQTEGHFDIDAIRALIKALKGSPAP